MMANEIRDEVLLDQIRALNRCDRILYEHWADMFANELLDKWLDGHMYEPNTFHTDAFAFYLRDNFVKWINRNL